MEKLLNAMLKEARESGRAVEIAEAAHAAWKRKHAEWKTAHAKWESENADKPEAERAKAVDAIQEELAIAQEQMDAQKAILERDTLALQELSALNTSTQSRTNALGAEVENPGEVLGHQGRTGRGEGPGVHVAGIRQRPAGDNGVIGEDQDAGEAGQDARQHPAAGEE